MCSCASNCLERLDRGDVSPQVCADCEREAERRVIAAADEFYDLAHAELRELVDVGQWKEITRKIDKAVQLLRKVRTVRRMR